MFVWAPEEEGQFQPGRCSRWWLKQSLGLFQQQLRGLGSDLIIREGTESSDTLLQLAKETGASALFFNHLYDPISLVRDHEVKQRLTEAGIECRSYNAGEARTPAARCAFPPSCEHLAMLCISPAPQCRSTAVSSPTQTAVSLH